MGNRKRLEANDFRGDDSFLRHANKKRHLRDGIVIAELFRDGHPELSFTFQDESLTSSESLDQYQRDNVTPGGDWLGLCRLYYRDFTRVSLEPRWAPDLNNERYGRLHCVTAAPTEDQAKLMAEVATRNGIVRQFRRKKEVAKMDRPKPDARKT